MEGLAALLALYVGSKNMKNLPDTEFSEFTSSRVEGFLIRLADALSRWRVLYWIMTVFWGAIWFSSKGDGPFVVLGLAMGSLFCAVFGHVSHTLLEVSRRAIKIADGDSESNPNKPGVDKPDPASS